MPYADVCTFVVKLLGIPGPYTLALVSVRQNQIEDSLKGAVKPMDYH